MGFYKDLFKNKNSYTGRLDMAIFYTNVFLILVHVFLSVFYFLVGHNLMLIINFISLAYYLFGLKLSIKHKNVFLNICFVEIWLHTLLGIICFGWDAYYQNWIFALVVAVFLPAFNPENQKQSYKQSFFFSFILLLSYLLFALLINTYNFSLTIKLSGFYKDFIFAFNNLVTFSAIIMFAITYTKNKELKEFDLIRKANYDELTKIFNRHALDTIEESIIKNSYSVAILDIDFFKKVNDTYGHASGDRVLSGIANILESHSNNEIIVGRWGGEEFVILGLPSIKYDDFVTLLEKIRIKIKDTKFKIKNGKQINCTVSIGSKYIKIPIKLSEAVNKADKNLYKAKQSGRNKVVS